MDIGLLFRELLEPSQRDIFNNLTRSPESSAHDFRNTVTESGMFSRNIGFPAHLIPESGAWPAYTTHTSRLVQRLAAEDRLRNVKSQAAQEKWRLGTYSGKSSGDHTPRKKQADVPEESDSAERTAGLPEPGVGRKSLFTPLGNTPNAEGLFSQRGPLGDPSNKRKRILFCRKKPLKAIGGLPYGLQSQPQQIENFQC